MIKQFYESYLIKKTPNSIIIYLVKNLNSTGILPENLGDIILDHNWLITYVGQTLLSSKIIHLNKRYLAILLRDNYHC